MFCCEALRSLEYGGYLHVCIFSDPAFDRYHTVPVRFFLFFLPRVARREPPDKPGCGRLCSCAKCYVHIIHCCCTTFFHFHKLPYIDVSSCSINNHCFLKVQCANTIKKSGIKGSPSDSTFRIQVTARWASLNTIKKWQCNMAANWEQIPCTVYIPLFFFFFF